MKLYLLSQDVNNKYDTFDSVVVAAKSQEAAKKINPDGGSFGSWCKPEFVKVKFIGRAAKGTPAGIILASYNAG